MSTVVRIAGGYLRGQTIASLVTGITAGVGLAIIGVPFATVLGVITFVLNYIPYVGPLIAGTLAFVLGLFVGPWVALGAIGVVVGAQNLTDALVTPRVMSDQVDLHPTLVIFSLLAGGALFGFWGMVFAIPIAAIGKALFVYYYERKTQRQLVTENGALFKAAQCDDDSDEPCAADEVADPEVPPDEPATQ
jgi:predicted PurR-regulated permease PerM